MTYALISGSQIVEYPLSESDIKSRFPLTSFTRPFTPPSGYVEIVDTPLPSISLFERAVESTPALVDGQWQRQWEVISISGEEQAEMTARQAEMMRTERKHKLRDTDWTQLSDAPVNASAWAAYRQELRDVTLQPGFPWDITWPEEPA